MPSSPVSIQESTSQKDFRVPDSLGPRRRHEASFAHTLLATTLSRCWHILLFFAAWSSLVSVLNNQGYLWSFQPTLLTVIGTVIGFIISYRTTSSFERYNEGRKLWSQIIYASRTLARTIWFHIPDLKPAPGQSIDDVKARALVEKKSAINLIEAFSVALKHYLRGEDGIYYQDLYYLVKFLPAYALPNVLPSTSDPPEPQVEVEPPSDNFAFPPRPLTHLQFPQNVDLSSPTTSRQQPGVTYGANTSFMRHREALASPQPSILPAPVTAKSSAKPSFLSTITSPFSRVQGRERTILPLHEEADLLPPYLPPKFSLFDIFPFSLLAKYLTKRGKSVKSKKSAKVKAKLHSQSHNLPLEISLYLSSYIAAIQQRKLCDVPATNLLLTSLCQLVDSLTGLERILTTPIPFSYSVHLWGVTALYCLAMPFQLWHTLKWVTIPATTLSSFIFFGFLVAGEEIENPFGYDKNDLNLDHFTQNIIRNELRAITAAPPPEPTHWAFVPENNLLFSDRLNDRVSPEEWLSRGYDAMQRNLCFE